MSTGNSASEHPVGVRSRDYTAWVREAASLARALGYPVQPSMINKGTGIVFGDSQYEAFANGLWSSEAYELMIIFEALNEPAVDGLPLGAGAYAEFGGLCDKLMILHPGKFCPPHYHPRKTETYEVVMGVMEVFYSPDAVADPTQQRLSVESMPKGSAWPHAVAVPKGRESTYANLTSYRRLVPGEPKFVMHRNHLHAFRCPPDSETPLVVREISTYSHEPTEAVAGRLLPLEAWAEINDNVFLSDSANEGRLRTTILP